MMTSVGVRKRTLHPCTVVRLSANIK